MNYHKDIIGYQNIIEKKLESFGWSLIKREVYKEDYWFLEMWTIQSKLNSFGNKLFLMFEYDDIFYSVAVSKAEPQEHHKTKWESRLYLKRGFEKNLIEFLSNLNDLRIEFD